MMKVFFSILILLVSVKAFSQAIDSLPALDRTIKVTDPFYREDQFYVGVTHSLMMKQPDNFSTNSISIGTNFGFLRDFPINKQRTVAIAPGVGFAFYNLRHNMALIDNDPVTFEIDNDREKNVQKLSYIEIPFEIRWRNSKVHSHKFWRVYTGIKYSYLLNATSKYEGVLGNHSFKNSDFLSRSNLGVYISAGFNTWNLYGYYGFKPLYNKNTIDTGSHINMLNVGLMFYIL